MKDLKNLLDQVSIITKKNAEFLDATGGRFNIFSIAGVNHYENTHSAILAELLNPKGSHGLKSMFLQAFIDRIKLKDELKDFDCENANVKTEAPTEDGRIDILIRDNKDHTIIIENKIYARDQDKQLKRYNAHGIKISIDKYQILYLTLNGTEASVNSGQDIKYQQVSYSSDIIAWLEDCLNLSARFPLVRETINQYINHLKQLTNQDMDTKNKEEIVRILALSEDSLQAAFTIFENNGALKDYLISNFFNPQLHKIADELNIKVFEELKARGKDQGFGFYVPKWSYFYIWFEFEAGDCRGLNYYYNVKDKERKPCETTVQKLSPKFEIPSRNPQLPCGYSYVTKYRNWNSDAYFAIYSGEMKKEIKRIVENMMEQAKDIEM